MPDDFPGGCASSATATGSSTSTTRCSAGIGRTGPVLAIEHYGVEPDLLVSGQVARRRAAAGGRHRARGGHGRGRPGRPRRHVRRQPGRVRGGASPSSTRWRRTSLPAARARARRAHPRGARRDRRARRRSVGEVRGLGPMLALELVEDRATKAPAGELAAATVAARPRARSRPALLRPLRERHSNPRPPRHRRRRPRARSRDPGGVAGT